MSEMIPVLVPMENVNDEAVILLRWLVADGADVTADQCIAEIETSKAVVELVAPRAGSIEFTAHPGQTVAVGSSIANLTVAGLGGDRSLSAAKDHEKEVTGITDSNASTAVASRPQLPGVRFSKKALELISLHGLSPEMFRTQGMVQGDDVLAMLQAQSVVHSSDNDLHHALRALSFDGVTLPSHSYGSAEGVLDRQFLNEIRENMEEFGKLPSAEKCEAYRTHGAAIGADVVIGQGAVILTPQLVLRDGVQIGSQSHVQCSEVFYVGRLSSFRQGLSVDASTVVIGENIFGCCRIEISGGVKNPWSVLYVGDTTFIGDDTILDVSRPIVIGKEVFVTQRSILITHNIGHSILEGFENCFEPVVLEDYCQIGMNSTVYAGIRIGSSAIVGSNSYVVSSVPAGKLAIGVPARVVRDAARSQGHNQQVQIARKMVRDFRQLLTLRGVDVSDSPGDGFIVHHEGRSLLLTFIERYPGNPITERSNDLTVILTLSATASAAPGFAVFDLLRKNVSGEDDIFVDTTREFAQTRYPLPARAMALQTGVDLMKKMAGSRTMARRVLEVTGSVLLLVATSPFFCLTALAIWLTDFGPVFFTQTRSGLYGKPFRMLKFRSMRVNDRPLDMPEEIGQRDPLITPVGRLIRRSKIDELPQLINVIRGDMSWVGPRPTVMSQVAEYTPFQRRRLEVLPGLTGWAQVNGGAEIPWEDRIILEVWFVDHRSIWLDLKILVKTVSVILGGHKANPEALAEALRYAGQQADRMNQELNHRKRGPLAVGSARHNWR